MSCDHDTPGTSSSCFSTGSNSSSAENISTVENGDLFVVSFLMPSQSPQHTDLDSYVHLPSCTCSFSSKDSSDSSSCSNDPYGLDEIPQIYDKKDNHQCRNPFKESRYNISCSEDDLLLKSMEKGAILGFSWCNPEQVVYPVIHWSTKCNESPPILIPQTHYGPAMVFNQGMYKELKRVIPPDVWLRKASESLSPPRRAWIIVGYKSLEKTFDSTLEATWKEWTGVRHIYLNLRNDFEIRKISFYHRIHPQDNMDIFMYLVLMEIGNVDNRNVSWLLDFIQRTRVERMKGFLTAYTEIQSAMRP